MADKPERYLAIKTESAAAKVGITLERVYGAGQTRAPQWRVACNRASMVNGQRVKLDTTVATWRQGLVLANETAAKILGDVILDHVEPNQNISARAYCDQTKAQGATGTLAALLAQATVAKATKATKAAKATTEVTGHLAGDTEVTEATEGDTEA